MHTATNTERESENESICQIKCRRRLHLKCVVHRVSVNLVAESVRVFESVCVWIYEHETKTARKWPTSNEVCRLRIRCEDRQA